MIWIDDIWYNGWRISLILLLFTRFLLVKAVREKRLPYTCCFIVFENNSCKFASTTPYEHSTTPLFVIREEQEQMLSASFNFTVVKTPPQQKEDDDHQEYRQYQKEIKANEK